MADLSEFETGFAEAVRTIVDGAVGEIKRTVDDIVCGLGSSIEGRVGEAFTFNENAIREELEDEYKTTPTELHELLDEHGLKELSAAIRRGDRDEAEHQLDQLVRDDTRCRDWVEQARYGRRAVAA